MMEQESLLSARSSQVLSVPLGTAILDADLSTTASPEFVARYVRAVPALLRVVDFGMRDASSYHSRWKASYEPGAFCELMYFDSECSDEKQFLRVYRHEDIERVFRALDLPCAPHLLERGMYALVHAPQEDVQIHFGILIPSQFPLEETVLTESNRLLPL